MEIFIDEDFIPLNEVKELEEWQDYEIKFDNIPILNKQIFSKSKAGNFGIINFKNFVGFTEIEGHRIFVKSKKFSNKQFDKMVNNIKNKIANLPFHFGSPTYLPIERIPESAPDILYHNFAYLRYIMCQIDERDTIETQIKKILYEPYRKLEIEQNYLNIDKINKISNETIYHIIKDSQKLVKISNNSSLSSTSLGKNLLINSNAYFPYQVYTKSIVSSFDTPENRFVKHFLKLCESVLEIFNEFLNNYPTDIFYLLDCNLHKDLEYMQNFLRTMQTDTIFSEVGALTFLPVGSTVLHKKEGYRNILEYYSSLNLITSYNSLEVELYKVIQNKNISVLYEIWCFFKIKEILDESIGICHKAIGAKFNERYSYLEWEFCLEYSNKLKLYYNKTFSRGSGSYSLALRPDITLEIGNEYYLFDAKFKMDEFESENNDEIINSTFKKEDLYKMHTYKDAIKNTKSVFILYPGENEIFFHEFKNRVENINGVENVIRDIIINKDYSNGVGVISLKP